MRTVNFVGCCVCKREDETNFRGHITSGHDANPQEVSASLICIGHHAFRALGDSDDDDPSSACIFQGFNDVGPLRRIAGAKGLQHYAAYRRHTKGFDCCSRYPRKQAKRSLEKGKIPSHFENALIHTHMRAHGFDKIIR